MSGQSATTNHVFIVLRPKDLQALSHDITTSAFQANLQLPVNSDSLQRHTNVEYLGRNRSDKLIELVALESRQRRIEMVKSHWQIKICIELSIGSSRGRSIQRS